MSRIVKQKFATGIGKTAYVIWIIQWLWVCLLYVEQFFKTPLGKVIKPDVHPSDVVQNYDNPGNAFVLPHMLLIIIAVIGGAVLVVGVVYVIIKVYIPDVQRVAEETVQKTADATTDKIIASHIIPAKNRKVVNARIVFWLKVIASLTPVLVVFIVPGISQKVPSEVARMVATVLASVSFIFVILQYALIHQNASQ